MIVGVLSSLSRVPLVRVPMGIRGDAAWLGVVRLLTLRMCGCLYAERVKSAGVTRPSSLSFWCFVRMFRCARTCKSVDKWRNHFVRLYPR